MARQLKQISPTNYPDALMLQFINECEGKIQTEFLRISEIDCQRYTEDDLDKPLIVSPPHDKLYYTYLCAMIDLTNGEYNKYQNAIVIANSFMAEWAAWFNRTHRRDGREYQGVFLSAYGIAVKWGYQGTEEEWLASLKGDAPYIGNNGNWWIGDEDTGVSAGGGGSGGGGLVVVYDTGNETANYSAEEIEEFFRNGNEVVFEQPDGKGSLVYYLQFIDPGVVVFETYLGTTETDEIWRHVYVQSDKRIIYGEIRDPIIRKTSQLENDSGFISAPATAAVGQTIVVSEIDAEGKPTKWEARDTGDGGQSVELNLFEYGVFSDGTNAEATTSGINMALYDAVNNGHTNVVFPQGTYLIAADSQIDITGNLTVDFNHSTLIKEPNALEGYVMVEISGDHNVVKNATLYGDRDEHDYSSGGTHEWGIGIKIAADSRFTIIENVDVFDTTGYGIGTDAKCNQIGVVRDRPLEAGCYDKDTGNLVESTTHTVLGYTLDITDNAIKNDMFILGGNGYAAHGISEPLTFYMSFYDENETYIGFSLAHRLYDNVDLKSLRHWYPALRYIKFSIENTDTETNVTLELRSSYTSDDITIKNCEIARCRTLGIAITGGKRILVENVSIHDIGGAAPGYGVDIEDGYQLNQSIIFKSCEFYGNKFGDIAVIKARDVIAENCRFQGFQRPEGGTAVPQGISGRGAITSSFVVRSCVFAETSAGGENFHFTDCTFLHSKSLDGDFTECNFYSCQFITQYETTLNKCYFNRCSFLFRDGNFACYNSVFEDMYFWEDSISSAENSPEYWIMEGCHLKYGNALKPKTGAKTTRLINNRIQVASVAEGCLFVSTRKTSNFEIIGNVFDQAGRARLVYISDTHGSDIRMSGNTVKSRMTASEAVVNSNRVTCISNGSVALSDNTFDTAHLVASIPVLALENCSNATLTNNRFKGSYGVPIKMTSVTEALCDGNEYTGTPVLAENCKGVDIPNACGKGYVDSLIGDVSTVIASINSLVGGA